MQPTPNSLRRTLILGGAALLLFLVVKCLNTPRQDSSEKPRPNSEVKALIKERDLALKRADSLVVVADTAVAHSREAYALGLEAGKEAAALKAENHLKPTPHAQAPTPASTKQLQQFFNDY